MLSPPAKSRKPSSRFTKSHENPQMIATILTFREACKMRRAFVVRAGRRNALMKRPFHLPKAPHTKISQCFQGFGLHRYPKTGDIPGGRPRLARTRASIEATTIGQSLFPTQVNSSFCSSSGIFSPFYLFGAFGERTLPMPFHDKSHTHSLSHSSA